MKFNEVKDNEFKFSSDEVLDRCFPKGNKKRGNALLLFGCSKLEGIQEGKQQAINKITELKKGFIKCKNMPNMSNSQIIFYKGVDMAYEQFVRKLEDIEKQLGEKRG